METLIDVPWPIRKAMIVDVLNGVTKGFNIQSMSIRKSFFAVVKKHSFNVSHFVCSFIFTSWTKFSVSISYFLCTCNVSLRENLDTAIWIHLFSLIQNISNIFKYSSFSLTKNKIAKVKTEIFKTVHQTAAGSVSLVYCFENFCFNFCYFIFS